MIVKDITKRDGLTCDPDGIVVTRCAGLLHDGFALYNEVTRREGERELDGEIEWVNMSNSELLATSRAPPLLIDGPAYAGIAEDVAAGGDSHLGASLLKCGGTLHAYRALDHHTSRGTGH